MYSVISSEKNQATKYITPTNIKLLRTRKQEICKKLNVLMTQFQNLVHLLDKLPPYVTEEYLFISLYQNNDTIFFCLFSSDGDCLRKVGTIH